MLSIDIWPVSVKRFALIRKELTKKFSYEFKVCKSVIHRTIQINHQPDATIFQFIMLTFIYNSTCFGRFSVHHQELNDCSDSLWFYLRMMGGKTPETCWAVNKRQDNKLENCCIWFVVYLKFSYDLLGPYRNQIYSQLFTRRIFNIFSYHSFYCRGRVWGGRECYGIRNLHPLEVQRQFAPYSLRYPIP
jgi:hypothetical protein